jgi:hypothetical protein
MSRRYQARRVSGVAAIDPVIDLLNSCAARDQLRKIGVPEEAER